MFNTRENAHVSTVVAFSLRTRRHAPDGAANVSRRDPYRTEAERTLTPEREVPA